MSISRRFRKAFVAAPLPLPSATDLEHDTQRRMFRAFAGMAVVLLAVYGVVFWLRDQRGYALECLVIAVAVLVAAAAAARADAYAWPLRLLSGVMFAWLAVHTLAQGPSLPGAGWWLSIIPFILAGAGMYHLAIAAVFAFVGTVRCSTSSRGRCRSRCPTGRWSRGGAMPRSSARRFWRSA